VKRHSFCWIGKGEKKSLSERLRLEFSLFEERKISPLILFLRFLKPKPRSNLFYDPLKTSPDPPTVTPKAGHNRDNLSTISSYFDSLFRVSVAPFPRGTCALSVSCPSI